MIRVCPKCDVPLFILHFKDIEIDFCNHCRGLWLDAGELEALMQQTGANTHDPLLKFQQQTGVQPSGRPHLCPRCDAPLHEIRVSEMEGRAPSRPLPAPLTLDKCPRGHGLWFDADELQQLLATFPPESGAGRTIDYLNEIFTTKSKL
ncbi:MAG TPA: zf-TFIIB domain-containing protein [Verrucomicrobiae bacterium]|nr:zf-TFIIB domain-containing protein [Verrucomicrobiae bacterium]